MKDLRSPDGRDRIVRQNHGHGPDGIGAVRFRRAKVRDLGAAGEDDRVRFSSAILPAWARRTKSLDALLPSRALGASAHPIRSRASSSLSVILVQAAA